MEIIFEVIMELIRIIYYQVFDIFYQENYLSINFKASNTLMVLFTNLNFSSFNNLNFN